MTREASIRTIGAASHELLQPAAKGTLALVPGRWAPWIDRGDLSPRPAQRSGLALVHPVAPRRWISGDSVAFYPCVKTLRMYLNDTWPSEAD